MRTVLLFTTIFSLLAAEAPLLTDAQKLSVREAQLALSDNRAEIAELESHLKDLKAMQPTLQKNFDDVRMGVTPEGYVLQPDLKLTPCKFVGEPGCKAKAARE